jgi:hypothetical protein
MIKSVSGAHQRRCNQVQSRCLQGRPMRQVSVSIRADGNHVSVSTLFTMRVQEGRGAGDAIRG